MNRLNSRYYSLDYLRGLMALFVMIYHYSMWLNIPISTTSVIAKLGVYAVIIFYILSGLSLSLVYGSANDFNYSSFYIKRFFRIFPLYFSVVILTIALQFINFKVAGGQFNFDAMEFLLNTTLLFGVFSPSSYIPIGGWSIGNEICFYILFPLLVFVFTKKSLILRFIILFLSFICFIFLNFFKIKEDASAWSLYIVPYNHVFVFVFGFIIGFVRPVISLRKLFLIICLFCVLVFCFYTPEVNNFSMLFGWDRFTLTSLICMFTFAYYLVNFEMSGSLHTVFNWLGEHCYSIYLTHPLVFFPIN
ncbi:MAG: acyltransferase, partial [Bacteroidetes bacterium]|nr:acyltransferase [Bacteroidota bacterium]